MPMKCERVPYYLGVSSQIKGSARFMDSFEMGTGGGVQALFEDFVFYLTTCIVIAKLIACVCFLWKYFTRHPVSMSPAFATCVLLIHLAFLKIWAKTKSSIKACGL